MHMKIKLSQDSWKMIFRLILPLLQSALNVFAIYSFRVMHIDRYGNDRFVCSWWSVHLLSVQKSNDIRTHRYLPWRLASFAPSLEKKKRAMTGSKSISRPKHACIHESSTKFTTKWLHFCLKAHCIMPRIFDKLVCKWLRRKKIQITILKWQTHTHNSPHHIRSDTRC